MFENDKLTRHFLTSRYVTLHIVTASSRQIITWGTDLQ